MLREESIQRQLNGRLPSTLEGQSKNYENLVDASDLNLGDTAVFDSLIFGISSENVTEILDALAGDYEHSANGLGESILEVMENKDQILPMAMHVIRSSTLIKNGISDAVKGPILLMISFILLMIARKRVKKYQRRRAVPSKQNKKS